ncbi:MAG TPA: hypothetical protein VFW34_03115 [Candidatus Rubrimentiphilum sp.]|nr:hypothetical protein [Candidatus Rubrimentiphilum sp.]
MRAVNASVGYAADDAGNGVAYVRMNLREGGPRVLRVPFRVQRQPALSGREVGYAALTAVCAAARRRAIDNVRFAIDDRSLIADLRRHEAVPPPLAMPYVRLGCALNQFRKYEIADLPPGDADLSARARSEAALHVAA